MPTVDENRQMWAERHAWPERGDEWSAAWGGTDTLWWGTVMPRVHRFLPAATVLEIAPGHGRMTQYLRRFAGRLVLVDLNESCIEACRARFGEGADVEYHVNDGRSLAMIAPASVDFAFSFDSLVHADADVVESYVGELARVLVPGGAAFVHHSNLGEYFLPARGLAARPEMARLRRRLNRNWRSEDVSAVRVAGFARAAGLRCASQETVCWLSRLRNDCFTVLVKDDGRDVAPVVVRNRGFMAEARRLASLTGP